MTTATVFPDAGSRSSLFEKLSPDFRRRLDQAIIDRDPPGYRDLYAKFNLAEHGVGLTAFYYYARRVRARADMLYTAQLALPETPGVNAVLPDLFAYRLLDALNDEASTPNLLYRLAEGWRLATATLQAHERRATLLQALRRQVQDEETERLCQAVREHTQNLKSDLASRTAALATIQAALSNPPPAEPVRTPDARRGPVTNTHRDQSAPLTANPAAEHQPEALARKDREDSPRHSPTALRSARAPEPPVSTPDARRGPITDTRRDPSAAVPAAPPTKSTDAPAPPPPRPRPKDIVFNPTNRRRPPAHNPGTPVPDPYPPEDQWARW